MVRKKETLTLSVPPGTKEKLDAIARRLKIFWGKNPSPSGLVVAIANQTIEVGKSFTLEPSLVRGLRQAIRDLVDAGHEEEAESVITLLLDRGQLAAPLRQELIKQLGKTTEGFRLQVDQYIAQQQPFRIFYLNSQDQSLEFIVRYAQVEFQEKRFYLQIWCEETEDSTDLPELRHNRCLRLDRIQGIISTSGEWRGQFDAILVELHLYGWLVKAYEPKPEDREDILIDEATRKVIRQVVNPFWLIREVLRYGKDCQIISPESMRDRLKQELIILCQNYGLID